MRTLFSAILFLFIAASLKAQLISNPQTLANMSQALKQKRSAAELRATQLFTVLERTVRPEERQALEYLFAYMPLSDLADYQGDYFLEQVKKTIQARNEMPWGQKIPEEEFLHFVLPIRVNNENLDEFRTTVYDELKGRIRGMDMRSAALEINHWCHEKVTYRGSDERTSSPLASLKTSFGRCGEESTFTVSAMRAMGIPARQVYTPRWAHSDDNHAWVEVWIDGKWYFLGACEPDADLNMGWFAAPAMRAMLVHTRAYGWYNGDENVIDRQDNFSELNLIKNYAETKPIVIKVINTDGKPAVKASVEYQLYNYAEFYPIAKGKTDANGFHSITTGLGDLLIWATLDGAWNYKKITIEKTDTLTLQLLSDHPSSFSENFDLIPPVEKAPPETSASPASRAENARRLLVEDSIRMTYMQTFKDSAWSVNFARKMNLDEKETISIFQKSYGNWQEIVDFLSLCKPELHVWALSLLESISEKDLRDTRSEILTDHLLNAAPYPAAIEGEEAEFYSAYILSGRISNEMMRPWRGYLQQQFTMEFKQSIKSDIQVLIQWIRENIRVDDIANLHSRSPLSPRGVFELKVADTRSRDIFFVAVCRSLHIASRINPATYLPQYWNGQSWINVAFEPVKENISAMGSIRFTNANQSIDPKYAIHFTIARFKEGVYRSVDFEYGQELSKFKESIDIEAGKYYLVTGNRQSDGSVLSSLTFFEVPEGKLTVIPVLVRESFERAKPWAHVDLSSYSIKEYPNKPATRASKAAESKGAIYIWIDPDKEPSKHVMADIPAVKTLLEKWNGGLVFLLQKERISQSFNPGLFPNLPAQSQFAFDEQSKLLNELSRLKKHKLENNFPVIIISDAKGNLVYFSEGYKIGIGEQLAKEVSHLQK
ncbi:MAG: transglutaminase domain-containing protein [Bacteroidales bacterium]|nr:transglutaminase domain-containing protein [Bacteroidales bacterium]